MTTPADPKYTNALVDETSPYLLQHAHNPVDWHPWGEAAIQKARDENKPIFLSIGYSACHWCHVMERESFENEEIARQLNELFVCIKVDREERPDLDDIYMQATQLLTGQGGWPMSVFLTPELKPFFAGTYFPPVDGPRGVGFATIVERLHEAFEQEHEKVVESSEEILRAIGQAESAIAASGAEVAVGMLDAATRSLESSFDRAHGGFGGAPKFPAHSGLDLLLRECRRRGEPQLLDMVVRTLDHMAAGGIHDQILGGFARYSVDARWLVPHFEKMLYDNAQLASRYLDLYSYLGNGAHLRVARRALDYVLRDMTDAAGGYYSAQDADSEGEEGKFYVWTKAEVIEILGAQDGALYCEFFDITEGGNFEGKCIPNIVRPAEEFAHARDLDPEDFQARIDALSAKLEEVRRGRIAPAKDDKVLTAWNGLMISAMARAAQVTGEEKYRDSAEKAARFILDEMRDEQGNLLRVWREGTAKVPAFAEDYANLILGLIELYQTTFDAGWLEAADGLARGMIDRFYDAENGGFFTTDGEDPSVILRKKEYYDGVTPSGNSGATMALLRLGLILDNPDYREAAMKTLDSMHPYLTQMPGGVHFLLCAAETVLNPPAEVAIVGNPESEQTKALVQAIYDKYLPGLALAVCGPDAVDKGFHASIALLRGKKQVGEKPTAYVCKNYQCEKPVHTVDELLELLS